MGKRYYFEILLLSLLLFSGLSMAVDMPPPDTEKYGDTPSGCLNPITTISTYCEKVVMRLRQH